MIKNFTQTIKLKSNTQAPMQFYDRIVRLNDADFSRGLPVRVRKRSFLSRQQT